jgi:hypothetical protein
MTRRSVLILAAIVLVGALAGAQTWAAYDARTANGANSFASGTVALSDNDSGTALLSLANATPNATTSGCIRVTYAGTLASTVRLHGTTTGTGLDAYLVLKVTRGSFPGAPPAANACTGFAADATDYIGAGAGVVYNGTLLAFPDDYANGLVDPLPGAPATWTASESHVYKLEVTLQDNVAAETKNATQTFTWEARNT